MGECKVRIYRAAKQDLSDLVDYINTLSYDAAATQYDRIVESISSLSEFPERCPLLKHTNLRAKGYRALVVDNYLVFFVVVGDVVQIRRILYGRRNYEWLL